MHVYTYDSSKHFNLRNEIFSGSNNFNCTMKTHVEKHIVNYKYKSYDITFECTYNGTNEEEKELAKKLHPMVDDKLFMEYSYHSDGMPVNNKSSLLMKHILTPIDELYMVSGNTEPYEYHQSLLRQLNK